MNKLSIAPILLGIVIFGEAQSAYDEGSNKTIINQTGQMSTSDENMTRRISDLLRSASFSTGYDLVTFTIDQGKVILQGSVETSEDKIRLEKAIRTIGGVKSVDNQLIVRNRQTSQHEKINHNLYAYTINKNKPIIHTSNPFSQDNALTVSDKQLNKNIRSQLKSQGFWEKYTDVRLNTNNGVVTLEGIIPTSSDQQKLVNSMQKVRGVKSIESNLTIRNNNNNLTQ